MWRLHLQQQQSTSADVLPPGVEGRQAWLIVQAWAQTSSDLPDNERAARVAARLAHADLIELSAERCLLIVEHMRLILGTELPLLVADRASSEAMPYDALPPQRCPLDGDGKAHVVSLVHNPLNDKFMPTGKSAAPQRSRCRLYTLASGTRTAIKHEAWCSCGAQLKISTWRRPGRREDEYYDDVDKLPIFQARANFALHAVVRIPC